jgi:ABC-type sugar transport system permease subunit
MSLTQGTSREAQGDNPPLNSVIPVALEKIKTSPQQLRQKWAEFGYAMIYMAPALAIFVAFTFAPFIRAIWLSFFIVDRNTFEPAKFYELKYYERVFNIGDSSRGDEYLKSILTTFQFALMVVPLGMITAIALAVLATAKVKIIGVFRTIFTSSIAISVASAGVIWSLIYNPNTKVTQWLMDLLNVKTPSLLNDAGTALPAVAFMTVWTALGFNFIITLSGIQAIPQDLYESGLIDGANGWKSFRFITLPLLTPTLLFLFIISTISCFQSFTQFKVLIDSAGPNNSTNVFVYSIFNAFWQENNYGFASAMSVVLFGILLILTVIQFRLLDRRVHYQ